jgi:hypothetical protein
VAHPAGELPAVEGLDNLYQGQLDNILLTGERYTNPIRALYTGDLGYLEHRKEGGGTAYTISGILGLRIGDWEKRAYRSFKTSIRNGAPHIVLQDFNLDDRIWFEQDGIIYVDQVSAIKYEYDRQTHHLERVGRRRRGTETRSPKASKPSKPSTPS